MVITLLKPLLVGLLLAAVLANNDVNNNRKKFNVQMKVMPYLPAPRQLPSSNNGIHTKTYYQPNDSKLGGGIIAGERILEDRLLMLDVIMLDRVYPTAMSLLWTAEFHVRDISEVSVLNVGAQNATVEYINVSGDKTKKVEIKIKLPINGYPKLDLRIYGVRYPYGK